ncbi:MAG: hypothetical protein CME61_00775 [Halobacteriovoraceae bacterium]|nr:hypothetical protein [Halobacteriovoraceae bacterium]
MDNLVYGLVGMFVGFIVIYIYLSGKVDRTNYSKDLSQGKRSFLPSISATKKGIISLRKKSKIIHLFKSLGEKDKLDLLEKLKKEVPRK